MFVSPPAHHTVADPYPHVVACDKGETFTEGPVQELTFDDILDLVNPLQHLPVISTIYRAITGDKIKPAMQIMGDLGYGGPSGFVLSCFQVLFNQISGDDIGGHILSFLDGKDSPKVAAAPAPGRPQRWRVLPRPTPAGPYRLIRRSRRRQRPWANPCPPGRP